MKTVVFWDVTLVKCFSVAAYRYIFAYLIVMIGLY